jgi:hypothetical protein
MSKYWANYEYGGKTSWLITSLNKDTDVFV